MYTARWTVEGQPDRQDSHGETPLEGRRALLCRQALIVGLPTSPSGSESVATLWEAFDSSKQPSYIFRSAYDAKTLRSGEVQFKHEVDFKHSATVDNYRLSVRRVTFADGTVWVAPQLTYE